MDRPDFSAEPEWIKSQICLDVTINEIKEVMERSSLLAESRNKLVCQRKSASSIRRYSFKWSSGISSKNVHSCDEQVKAARFTKRI